MTTGLSYQQKLFKCVLTKYIAKIQSLKTDGAKMKISKLTLPISNFNSHFQNVETTC